MKRYVVFAATIYIAVAFLVLHAADETFKARLALVPLDATMVSTVSGRGSATAVLSGSKLSINGTFEGLATPATVARLHRAPRARRGPALVDLTVTKAASGTISGVVNLTPAQVEDLRQGSLYLQIHSEKAPEGNLWGWLFGEERRRP